MAMVTQINQLTSTGPTATAETSFAYNTDDTNAGTTNHIATPTSTGTNFSFVKSFIMDITTTNSLTMTNILFGKVANETTTGTVLWYTSAHAVGAYVHATSAPTSTSDNNVTAPTINSATAVTVPLISTPPSAYAAGPYSSTGEVGDMIETVCGVDNTNTTAGTAVATPTLEWSWTEG